MFQFLYLILSWRGQFSCKCNGSSKDLSFKFWLALCGDGSKGRSEKGLKLDELLIYVLPDGLEPLRQSIGLSEHFAD